MTVFAVLGFLLGATALAGIAPGSLRLDRAGTDVVLGWGAGTGPYSVYRTTAPSGVASPSNHLATTEGLSYTDPSPGGALQFYLVRDQVICAADADCDDGDPCTGEVHCDVAGNRCIFPAPLPRSTTDRLDDAGGPQLHMVYMLPSDGTDEGMDTSGQLEMEVQSAQSWLAGEAGDCMRWDRYEGALDATFIRLERTEQEIRDDPDWVDQTIRLELEGLGLDDPEKLYVVYYGGTTDGGECGAAAALGGGGPAVMFLVREPSPGQPLEPCPWFTPVSAPTDPVRGHWAGAAMHESFHALGMVPWCAPDHDFRHPGHLDTISSDIMAYDGTGYSTYTLDMNRSEYYGHANPDCLDLADSAVWHQPVVNPDPIPGRTAYVDPILIPCQDEPFTQSETGGAPATIRFVNTSSRAVQFYWLDFSGTRHPSELLQPHSDWCCGSTTQYHVYVATDEATGDCLGLYEMVSGDNRILITD
jgi:hypothetical protein